MTDTPISILQRAGDLGLKLGVRPGDKLTVQPVERCPTDFVETLREHKRDLLTMLQWPFVMKASPATVSRLAKKAIDAGKIIKVKREYLLAEGEKMKK